MRFRGHRAIRQLLRRQRQRRIREEEPVEVPPEEEVGEGASQ